MLRKKKIRITIVIAIHFNRDTINNPVLFTDYRDDKRNYSKIISTFIGDKRIVR